MFMFYVSHVVSLAMISFKLVAPEHIPGFQIVLEWVK